MPKDILLDSDGDIFIDDTADISIRHSVWQEVKIFLKWFFEEWRFNPPVGVPYFEEVFIKNPNTDRIAQIVREEAAKAYGVTEVREVKVTIDNYSRNAMVTFTIITDYGTFREEVTINV
ncbi:hypothetical protein AGMMS49975_08880 [Clostridia bacterium]|nr:hypothetical protein AGMMS49975_08880 [Clostridia bacterium]